jgi:hypothetical protein
MKKGLFLACLGVLFLSSVSFATIVAVNANYVDGGFTASGGDFGIGVFSLSDTADIVVEETGGGQTTYGGGSFSLTTSLENDVSAGPIASGEFSGGSFSIMDNTPSALLVGNILSINMQELYNDSGILGGVGQFQVTGGSLSGDFVPATGEIVEITFQVVPASIDDFQQNFAFVSNLTLTPVPEPATICLLGLGGLALLRKRRA